jgi:hypothetical protein
MPGVRSPRGGVPAGCVLRRIRGPHHPRRQADESDEGQRLSFRRAHYRVKPGDFVGIAVNQVGTGVHVVHGPYGVAPGT